MTDALFAVYSAKRRAEIAPGVGSATDMCMVGPNKGSFIPLGHHVLSEMHDCYMTVQEHAKASATLVNERMALYVQSLNQAADSQEQSTGQELHSDDEASRSEAASGERRITASEEKLSIEES